MKDDNFEVSFSLPPTVRAICRPTKRSASAVPLKPKYTRLPRITQVMAMALQFQEMLENGKVRNYADLARLGCVSRERISQFMMLTWLAPDIQEEILRLPQVPGGRFPAREGELRKIARLLLWEDQRQLWYEEQACKSN